MSASFSLSLLQVGGGRLGRLQPDVRRRRPDEERRLRHRPRRQEGQGEVASHLFEGTEDYTQEWIKSWAPGLVNFVPALAYHFCLNLPEAFMKPGRSLFADPCTSFDGAS